MNPTSQLERKEGVEHVEVTLDDLIIEHYDPPAVPPKVSAAMKGRRRRVPHHKSLLGMLLLGGIGVAVLAGAGFLGFKRLSA